MLSIGDPSTSASKPIPVAAIPTTDGGASRAAALSERLLDLPGTLGIPVNSPRTPLTLSADPLRNHVKAIHSGSPLAFQPSENDSATPMSHRLTVLIVTDVLNSPVNDVKLVEMERASLLTAVHSAVESGGGGSSRRPFQYRDLQFVDPDEDVRMLLSLIKEQHEQGGSLQTFSESCMWTLLTSAEAACNHRLASILSRAAHRSGSTSKRVHTEIAAEEAQITQRALGDLILVEEGVLRAVESLRGTGDVSDTATSVSLDEEFGCMTELLDDFILNMGNLLAEARLARRRSEMDQELVTLRIARERNMILRIGLLIQLITLLLAANSMISGWFGMNLDNGNCGPDGCHGAAESNHGYPAFLMVVIITTGVTFGGGVISWRRISKWL